MGGSHDIGRSYIERVYILLEGTFDIAAWR